MSTIDVLDETQLTLQEAVKQDQNEIKDMLKKKWKEVKEDFK